LLRFPLDSRSRLGRMEQRASSPVRQRGESLPAPTKQRCAMRQGVRLTSPRFACWASLVLLPLPACRNSPAPEKPEPDGRADTAMFSEAEAYERFMGSWSRRLAPAFVEFAGLKDRDRVLDVGSGTGALAIAVLEAAPASRVVGIDPSPAYVAYARTRVLGGHVTFEEGDAQRLRFPTGPSTRPSPCSSSISSRTGRPRCARSPKIATA
jgi:hypothetical protein